ncbi:proteasome subunit alpha type-3, putative [Plasmodium chabaudi chabaudi]|uniref:Proteasome subunit alpha type-3, putative n=1 Tax=Plasmodium chabaudi chabaudi TaxID=31271 RepID=A0A077TLF5_PLACU|nr:proteasome subunit alpha type-3, putative [Plasmodium chabaudi chabaudi]SCM20848.1 proteasome subunit alpha type-3, putative [Plasmodium chabaudi chabaudi]SCN59431.1 proteasome subunit alpha type-3, putative [Plasmodium chabaudi chabaudi]VTZ68291.1 proteasome subunit alpha type-3, putative [Plasmodium chabaudi chabaudi]|eukprot:XP_742132.2 proteasome component C8, putative [Plasmodium chabaudi chabaudi]
MAGLSAGYDLSVSTFSPDGRLYQVEYIYKAINNNNTSISLECKDGVISCSINTTLEKNKMIKKNSYNRIYYVNNNIIITYAGLDGDARNIIDRIKSEANNYFLNFHTNIPLHILANRISLYIHAYTLYWHLRPFASSIIISSYDKNEKGEIYCIEPSGACYKYYGVVIGKNKELFKTEIEKKDYKHVSVREALVDIYKFILGSDDHINKDNISHLVNFSWICEESSFESQTIDQEILDDALNAAVESVNQLN